MPILLHGLKELRFYLPPMAPSWSVFERICEGVAENKFHKQILQIIRNTYPEIRDVKYAVGGLRVGIPLQKRILLNLFQKKQMKIDWIAISIGSPI